MYNLFQNNTRFFDQDVNFSATIYAGDQRMSLGELFDKSDAFARLLSDAGCREGENICCMAGKSINFLVCLLGINKAGCTCIPVNPGYTTDQVQSIFLECDVSWIIADECAGPLLLPGTFEKESFSLGWIGNRRNLPPNISPEFIWDNLKNYSLQSTYPQNNLSNPAFVFYTPGISERIEGALFTNLNVQKFAEQILEVANYKPDDRVAGFMPSYQPRFLLELLIPIYSSSQLHLCDPRYLTHSSDAMDFFREKKITQIICNEEHLEQFAAKHTEKGTVCTSVKQIVSWGNSLSNHALYTVSNIFPNSICKNLAGIGAQKIPGRLPVPEMANKTFKKFHQFYKEKLSVLTNEFKPGGLRDSSFFPMAREVQLAYWKNEGMNRSNFNPVSHVFKQK